ncbi:hypothetical protein [Aquirufa rosea]|uniref:Carboxypeptidase-like regulatory domain-containing protein n=1 Tax=Aquirufa rosea TaxID=2509241 RepID=A0A4Q1BYB2_9BACT|nr:hypothetical protein [Aquirufa rosea]RXK48082.1 hypothetical protein ESB04_08515 [Aquirufa rosea]
MTDKGNSYKTILGVIGIVFIGLSFNCLSQNPKINAKILDGRTGKMILQGIAIVEDSLENHINFTQIENGFLSIEIPKNISIRLTVNSLGYQSYCQQFQDQETIRNLHLICLQPDTTYLLEEVYVKAKPIYQNQDTLLYKVQALKLPGDQKIEDLLKRLPGITVDEYSGKIKYKNKRIQTVLLDGENLLDQNYSLATKNIAIDDIDEVQAIEHFTENSIINNLGSSEEVALNLTFKKKFTLSNSSNIDAGIIESSLNALQIKNNTLINTPKIKSIINGSFNNIGNNNSSIEFSNVNSDIATYSFLPEKLIPFGPSFLNSDLQKTNRNNQLQLELNSIFKLHNKFKIKVTSARLKDKYSIIQENASSINLPNQSFSISDNRHEKTILDYWLNSIYSKYQASKNLNIEWKYHYTEASLFNSTEQVINSAIDFNSNQNFQQRDHLANVIITSKLGPNSALIYTFQSLINTNDYDLHYLYKLIPPVDKFQLINHRNHLIKNTFQLIQVFIPKILIAETKLDANQIKQTIFNFGLSRYSEKSINLSQTLKGKISKLDYNFTVNHEENRIDNNGHENNYSIFNYSFKTSFPFLGQFIEYRNSKSNKSNYRNYILTDSVFLNSRHIRLDSNLTNIPILYTHTLSLSNSIQNNLYYNFSYRHSKINSDYYQSQEITNLNIIQKNIWLDQSNTMTNTKLEVNFFVQPLSINLKSIVEFTSYQFPNIVNKSQLRINESSTFHLGMGFSTGYLKGFSIQNIFHSYYNAIENNSTLFENFTLRNQFQLFFSVKKIAYRFESQSFQYSTNASPLHFLDFSILYRPEKSSWSIALRGINLLNNTEKKFITISDYGTSSLTNPLLGRSLLISFSYTL